MFLVTFSINKSFAEVKNSILVPAIAAVILLPVLRIVKAWKSFMKYVHKEGV